MQDTAIEVNGRAYFIDTTAFTFGTGQALISAVQNKDERRILRTAQSMLVLAVGLETILSMPSQDYQELMQKVFDLLSKQ